MAIENKKEYVSIIRQREFIIISFFFKSTTLAAVPRRLLPTLGNLPLGHWPVLYWCVRICQCHFGNSGHGL